MTTRDPRLRNSAAPGTSGTPVGEGGREPTQSLELAPGEQPSPASLALGTHNRQLTSIASPNGRGKPPESPVAARAPAMLGHHPEAPEAYLDAVLGSYRVIDLLGKGGMGYVYRAEHIKLGREVALKLLRSDYAIRRDAVARFFQEARTVNRVRHRNIVDVTDFVELDDGTTYIIMELLTGTSLGAWAKHGIDLPRALAVLVQICDGLAAAHQVGVVHRDLKPDNVIVVPTSDGAELVKLLDFGVAKLLNRDDEDVGFQTAAGSVIGTPAYMSPEQAGGMAVDARSDIYSLGAIMYELFCGQPMFRGRSFGEYVRKHLTEVPVPPRQTPGGAGLAPQLEALILKALDKDPDQRFAHTTELRDALLHLLGGMEPHPPSIVKASGMRPQITQLPVMPMPGHAPMPAPPSSGSAHHGHASPTAPPTATSWWVWFVRVGIAVGLGVAAAAWYAGHGEPTLGPRSVPASTRPAQATAQPIAQPTAQPAAHPPPIEVRFDSLPSGGVFAEGHAAELCRTPCALNIDLSDGGPTDRRAFVVRRDGYVDGAITVDLTGDKRAFHVMLLQAAPASPPPAEHAADRVPGAKADPKLDRRPARPPIGKAPRKDARDAKDVKGAKAAATDHEPKDAKSARAPDTDRLIDPTGGQRPPTKKPPVKPTIDPSDTLDPFQRKP